jgi:hypothetical protein
MKEYCIYKNKTNQEEIRIIEDFFTNEILEKILDYFKDFKWKCQCQKDGNTSSYSGDRPYWRIELEEDIFFNSFLKNIIEKYFTNSKLNIEFTTLKNSNNIAIESSTNLPVNRYKLKRVYVVGQTYGQDSVFHIDDDKPNTYTFCYYINEIVHIQDDGLFHLKIPNEKYIITIEPLMNRAIIFPSGYRHKGCGLNRFNENFRICIAWKFQIL